MDNSYLGFDNRILDLAAEAESSLAPIFAQIDAISAYNTEKVLSAFHKHRVTDACFAGTTGYGYDDFGRDKLDSVYAEVFNTEDALVRVGIVSGTHAITCALFGALMPGDTLLSAIGMPYDTLRGVIGIYDRGPGSLKDYGVGYIQADVTREGLPDLAQIAEYSKKANTVLIQRSRGYSSRQSLSIEWIERVIGVIRKSNPAAKILVDNCYGEFAERLEPTDVGADLVVGSLIKNPGGGLAPTGGYLAGTAELINAAAMRLTAPGIGRECGSTLGNNRMMYQGLFMAPHTVAQAMKTAVFGAKVMEILGYKADPPSNAVRADIVQMIEFGDPSVLRSFCRGIQAGAPVDSFVTPEPWDMPGYDCPVIMAAGSFIQGASIELSADGPMREPYTAYMQGGLTYESGKVGILLALREIFGHNSP